MQPGNSGRKSTLIPGAFALGKLQGIQLQTRSPAVSRGAEETTVQKQATIPLAKRQTRLIDPPPREKPRLQRENAQPESERPRRSAVDAETLSYLGHLAKRDPEAFVYPKFTTIARKIDRTAYYLQQRVRYLENIGRLIPAKRVRKGREISGWLFVRYQDWPGRPESEAETKAKVCASQNRLAPTKNNFAQSENNLAVAEDQNAANSLHPLAVVASIPRESVSFEVEIGDGERRQSPSQSTKNATATKTERDLTERSLSRIKTVEQRLIERIKRTTGTLKSQLEWYRRDGHADLADHILGLTRAPCSYLAYRLDVDEPTLTECFCEALSVTWEKYELLLRDGSLSSSAFCSKVIDLCFREYDRTWPVSFTRHRDKLRETEKAGRLRFYVYKEDGLERIKRVDPQSLHRPRPEQVDDGHRSAPLSRQEGM